MSSITTNICDRCGKEIKYHGWVTKFRNVLKKGSKIKIFQTYNGCPTGYDYHEHQVELCSECTEQFKMFLNEKKV